MQPRPRVGRPGHQAAKKHRRGSKLLNPLWTARSAALGLKWQMKGACWEWLLTGQNFDLTKVAGQGVKTLITGFRRASVSSSSLEGLVQTS